MKNTIIERTFFKQLKKSTWMAVISLVVFSFLTQQIKASAPEETTRECGDNYYSAELLQFDENDGCLNIQLQINVEAGCHHALSHMVVEVPCGEISNVSNSEGWIMEIPTSDPSTGLSGFKIDEIQGFGEDKKSGSFTLSYTVCGDFDCLESLKDSIKIAYKAATCVFYEEIEIPVEESNDFTASIQKQDVSCFGGNNGSAEITIDGGTAPFTFEWSNGSTSQNISGLKVGSYEVIISDASGATVTLQTEILQPESSLSVQTELVNPSCASKDGSISLNVSGGTAPYAYTWNNGGTESNLNNVYAGNYSVQILDSNGCSHYETIQLKEETDLAVSLTPNILECYQEGQGTIESSVSGGTAPYSYEWSNQDTTANLSDVNSGSYSLTVVDAEGCSAKNSTAVGIKKLSLSTAVINPTCHGGDDGTVSITDVRYGSEPYTYLWDNGETTSSITGVESGRYRVTVTDVNGCEATRTINLADRQELNLNQSISRTDCDSPDTNVELSFNGTGGMPSYEYYLNGELISSPYIATEAGDYTITMTDALGCEKTETISISSVSQNISVTSSIAQPACGGALTGSVDLTASGGLAPYVFLWSDGYLGAQRDNVNPGNYIVEVKDENGCTITEEVTIDTADEVSVELIQPENPACETSGNSIQAIVSGANTFNWEILDNDTYYIESSSLNTLNYYAGTGSATIAYTALNAEGCFAADTITIQCSADDSSGGDDDSGDDNGSGEISDDLFEDGFYSEIDEITPIGDNCYEISMTVYTNGKAEHDLSHLVVGLDYGYISDVENSKNYKVEKNITDPTTGVYGFKLDDISNFGKCRDDNFTISYTVCFDHPDIENYFPEYIEVAYKASTDVFIQQIPTNQLITTAIQELSDHQLLVSAYPNPFRTEAKLQVTSSVDSYVKIEVYDLTGLIVENIYQGYLGSGIEYTFKLTGGNSTERIFFYKVISDVKTVQGKLLKY